MVDSEPIGADEAVSKINIARERASQKRIKAVFTLFGAEIVLALPNQDEMTERIRKAKLDTHSSVMEELGGRFRKNSLPENERKELLDRISKTVSSSVETCKTNIAVILAECVLDLRDPEISDKGNPCVTADWIEQIGIPLADSNPEMVVRVNNNLIVQLVTASLTLQNRIYEWLTNVKAFMAAVREAELKNSGRPHDGIPVETTSTAATVSRQSLKSPGVQTSVATPVKRRRKSSSGSGACS